MPLNSLLFAGDPRLEKCLISDPAHVQLGDAGEFVTLIQDALRAIDQLEIDPAEIEQKRYGRSTAAAVLAYKRKRGIINRSYQSAADNIVGKMTIKSLDDDMLRLQGQGSSNTRHSDATCTNMTPFRPVVRRDDILPPEGLTLPPVG